jgi:excisionase family DNA binding protein
MTGGTWIVLTLPDGTAGAFAAPAVVQARVDAATLGFASATAAGAPAGCPERWLTSQELAAATGVNDTKWEALARAGRVPCLKVGKAVRFKLSEVEAAIRAAGPTPPGVVPKPMSGNGGNLGTTSKQRSHRSEDRP